MQCSAFDHSAMGGIILYIISTIVDCHIVVDNALEIVKPHKISTIVNKWNSPYYHIIRVKGHKK